MFNAEESNLTLLRSVRLKAQDVPLDPASVFDSFITGSAGWSSNDAGGYRSSNFCDSLGSSAPARFQIVPIFCDAYCGTSRWTGHSAGCKTCTRPTALTKQFFAPGVIVLRRTVYITRSGCGCD
jgi:hypothetical protein